MVVIVFKLISVERISGFNRGPGTAANLCIPSPLSPPTRVPPHRATAYGQGARARPCPPGWHDWTGSAPPSARNGPLGRDAVVSPPAIHRPATCDAPAAAVSSTHTRVPPTTSREHTRASRSRCRRQPRRDHDDATVRRFTYYRRLVRAT